MNDRDRLDAVMSRFSCRTFAPAPLPPASASALAMAAGTRKDLPFGSEPRFALIAGTEEDSSALKGLGTYGFIRNPAAFLAGTSGSGPGELEDFGYRLEELVIEATALGIGSCILGGSFARSRFARVLAERGFEGNVPCVVALGRYPVVGDPREGRLRRVVGGAARKPWTDLFARDGGSLKGTEEERAALGPLAACLDALRAAPSASNKQPWRAEVGDGRVSLFLRRTPGYASGLSWLIGVMDMQRVDMGIAMANYAIAAAALGSKGSWRAEEGVRSSAGHLYTATWS